MESIHLYYSPFLNLTPPRRLLPLRHPSVTSSLALPLHPTNPIIEAIPIHIIAFYSITPVSQCGRLLALITGISSFLA